MICSCNNQLMSSSIESPLRSCSKCTYINSRSTILQCEMCGEILETGLKISCTKCTYMRDAAFSSCPICEIDISSAFFSRKRNRSPPSQTEPIRSSKLAVDDITVVDLASSADAKVIVTSFPACPIVERRKDATIIFGIIPELRRCLERRQMSGASACFGLCSDSVGHISQTGARGAAWSCGYRNIQMLLYSLGHPVAAACVHRLIGDELVHSVSEIQQRIDAAWRDGFDPPVCHLLIKFSP